MSAGARRWGRHQLDASWAERLLMEREHALGERLLWRTLYVTTERVGSYHRRGVACLGSPTPPRAPAKLPVASRCPFHRQTLAKVAPIEV